MRHPQSKKIRKIRAGILILFSSIFSCGIFYARLAPEIFVANAQKSAAATRTKPRARQRRKAAVQPRPARYSEFPHSSHKMKCDACHKFPSANWKTVRKTDAFPDITEYPRHESCLSCHRQQFFKGAKPAICSICHTNPSPRD